MHLIFTHVLSWPTFFIPILFFFLDLFFTSFVNSNNKIYVFEVAEIFQIKTESSLSPKRKGKTVNALGMIPFLSWLYTF